MFTLICLASAPGKCKQMRLIITFRYLYMHSMNKNMKKFNFCEVEVNSFEEDDMAMNQTPKISIL